MPSRDLQKLHPEVRRRCLQFIEKCKDRGLDVFVTQTWRTEAEQVAFHAQGRKSLQEVNQLRAMAHLAPITKEQNRIITWVRTSVHQFGLAFDIAIRKEGGGVEWSDKADINENGTSDYIEVGGIGEDLGLIWGGRFKGRDLVHFEWTGGLTLADLKAGKLPPTETVKKTEKQEDTMNLLPYIPLVLKAVAFRNVKDEMDGRDDVMDRPFWLSGRFIGTVTAAVFGTFAAKIGMDINAASDNLTEFMNLAYDNKELLVSMGGMAAGIARGIAGFFQRKK